MKILLSFWNYIYSILDPTFTTTTTTTPTPTTTTPRPNPLRGDLSERKAFSFICSRMGMWIRIWWGKSFITEEYCAGVEKAYQIMSTTGEALGCSFNDTGKVLATLVAPHFTQQQCVSVQTVSETALYLPLSLRKSTLWFLTYTNHQIVILATCDKVWHFLMLTILTFCDNFWQFW